MSSHTPGPLVADKDCLIWKESTCVGSARTVWIGLEVQQANARLWAAAPDLLEVCKAINDGNNWGEDGFLNPSLFPVIAAAITKAEGEKA